MCDGILDVLGRGDNLQVVVERVSGVLAIAVVVGELGLLELLLLVVQDVKIETMTFGLSRSFGSFILGIVIVGSACSSGSGNLLGGREGRSSCGSRSLLDRRGGCSSIMNLLREGGHLLLHAMDIFVERGREEGLLFDER